MINKTKPTAEQIIAIIQIALFMGYRPITISQWENSNFETTDNLYWVDYCVNFHNDWNLLMPVVEKIESLMYFFNSAPFVDDEANALSGEHFCIIQHRTTHFNLPYLIDITGCSSKLEATFKACAEFASRFNTNTL